MRVQQFAQKAFVVHDGSLLMVRKSSGDPHNPGRWEVPGGRMSFGEDVDAHFLREVFEETGIEVIPGAPFHIWQWVMSDIKPGSDDEIQVVAIARRGTASSLELSGLNREATDFINDARWVPFAEIADLDTIPSLRAALQIFLGEQDANS